MWTRRILLFLPIAVFLVLGQSFFWVPTYDRQATGNPERLKRFVNASIGDAEILNPILSADSASSEIVDLVFDGLLDYDDQLHFRPRLATGWESYEIAYLTVNPVYLKKKGQTAKQFGQWLTRKLRKHGATDRNLKRAQLLPAETLERELEVPELDGEGKAVMEGGRPRMRSLVYRYHQPARIRFTLKEIDQDFFKPVREILGPGYFKSFPYESSLNASSSRDQAILAGRYTELAPLEEHNPVLIFTLRKGVQFHDGHEFDSGDVRFTYEALMNGRNLSPRRSSYEPVKSVKVLGPHKIKFVYKRLFSPAIEAWSIGILPEHLLNAEALKKEAIAKGKSPEEAAQATLRDSDFSRKPVGTGPFQFVEWRSDEMIRLKRNERYWEGEPEYKEYIMRIIPDSLTQEMEFYAGAVDKYAAEPHQVARLRKDSKYQNLSVTGMNYSYIGYNLRKPLFQDPEVRRALGMALNIDQILRYVLYNQGERVTGPYPKMTDWYDTSVEPLPYDPQGALKILNGLGWKKNAEGWLEKEGKVFEFNLITNNGNNIRKAILSIVQNQWRQIGVKCNTQVFEWAVFLKDFVNSLKFDAVVLGWSMGFDPDIYQLWHSSQAGPSQLNFVGFKNQEADRLIESIRKEYKRENLVTMTRKLHRIIANAQPYTFLFVGNATVLLDKKIVVVNRDLNENKKYEKIQVVKGGRYRYYFNKWIKLPEAPEFTPG